MLDHSDVFNAAFVNHHGNGARLGGAQRLNLRAQLAKKMVSSSQYSHLTKELEQKAAEHHEKEMNEWNLILDGISEAADVPAYVASFLILGVVCSCFYFVVPATRCLTPFIQ